MKLSTSITTFALAILFGAKALADNPPIPTPYIPTFQDTSVLGPVVVTDAWTNLSITNHPGYPGISGSQTWLAPIGPDTASARQALLQKQAGFDSETTDFLAASSGGGIYSFFSNTHFEISEGTPLTGVNTIQLQLSIAEGATGIDVFGVPSLILSTTTGTFTLSPTSSALLGQTPVTIAAFGNTQTDINLEAYSWDVSAYVGTINSFAVDWQVDQHSISYGAQVAQVSAVPEPSSAALIVLCGTVGLLRMRWRSRI